MIRIRTAYFTERNPEIFRVTLPIVNARPDETTCIYETFDGNKAFRCVDALHRHGIDSVEDLRNAPFKLRRNFQSAGCNW